MDGEGSWNYRRSGTLCCIGVKIEGTKRVLGEKGVWWRVAHSTKPTAQGNTEEI